MVVLVVSPATRPATSCLSNLSLIFPLPAFLRLVFLFPFVLLPKPLASFPFPLSTLRNCFHFRFPTELLPFTNSFLQQFLRTSTTASFQFSFRNCSHHHFSFPFSFFTLSLSFLVWFGFSAQFSILFFFPAVFTLCF